MKAFQLIRHGGPESLLFRNDLPIPQPGVGEVRIAVSAVGMNNTDIWSREGAYGTPEDPYTTAGWRRVPLEMPRIQGADVVGRVDAVGPDVPEDRIGERVVVNPALYGKDEASGGRRDLWMLGSEQDGGFAEHTVVPSANAHSVETPLSDEELAGLPIAYLTAEGMLDAVGLSRDERILVTGASGGVGVALVQLALLRGAEVVALSTTAKAPALRELGAETVVDREELERSGTDGLPGGGESVDVVADVVGGRYFSTLLNALAWGGRYVTAGAMAGALVETDLRTIYLKHLTLTGVVMGSQEQFSQLLSQTLEGKLRPPIAAVYPLEQLKEAQERFCRKDFIGNIVIKVGS